MNVEKKLASVLLVTIAFIHLLTVCFAEVVIQDVLWTKDYEEGENYFGTCRFVESPCGYNNEGVCLQRGDGGCYEKGGMHIGFDCQGGLGDCCHFMAGCWGNETVVSVSQLVTTLAAPVEIDKRCTFKLRKQPDICQVRLDFLRFSSERANADGVCETDWLRISNSITVDRDFTTCGDLTGQHMYLTFGNEEYIEIMPMSRMGDYSILATMIPCRSKNRVPDYCLQYYTKSTDQVRSFDFGGQQQNNQRYSICVKPIGYSESVQWRPCTGSSGRSFDIATNVEAAPLPCDKDWVQVKGQSSVCEPFVEIKSVWKPYELLVNFDGSELSAPQPETFNVPIDPANCAAGCVGQPPAYTCACIDNPSVTNQICQCVGSYGPSQLDFNNTGFCLEYTQL